MFSATFLPVNYFKEMISGDISDYAVYAHSPFDTSNKRVIVGRDVSSRYTRRNIKELWPWDTALLFVLIQGKTGSACFILVP